MESFVGKVISKQYQILEFYAEGGMSIVYRGLDTTRNREVAIKVLKEGITSSYIEDIIRFQREVMIVSKIKHPALVEIYEVGEFDKHHYIIMDFLSGTSLDEYIKVNEFINPAFCVELILKICDVLECVHKAGVIHRDIKPGNIIIQENEEQLKVKLLDFGLSQMLELSRIHKEEEIVGTFHYMAPEQSGIIQKPVDERSDLYALGIVFYRILTGQLPFNAREIGAILHQQVAKCPDPPCQVRKDTPHILSDIVMKLIEKDPSHRYWTVKGLKSDLLRFQDGETIVTLAKNDRLEKITYQTNLIGRDTELHMLKLAFKRLKRREGSVCFIEGAAGSGKSRLVNELKDHVYDNNGECIMGQCFDFDKKMPYYPFVESLNEYMCLLKRLPDHLRRKRIEGMKQSLGDLAAIMCQFNPGLIEHLDNSKPIPELSPEKNNRRFLMTCARFFLHLGTTDSPTVLILDDMQWTDDGTIALLEEILVDINFFPTMIVCVYRSNEIKEDHPLYKLRENTLASKIKSTFIPLSNLTEHNLTSMLCDLLLDQPDHIKELSRFIYSKSKGNPFYSLEIIRTIIEEQGVVFQDPHWEVNWERINTIKVPDSVLDIILKRTKTLPSELQEFLGLLSVLGKRFQLNFLFLFFNKTEEHIISLIDQCISLQLLQHGALKGDIQFVHDKIRKAFYQQINVDDRRQIHLDIAALIEQQNSPALQGCLLDLAYHYDEGGNQKKFLQYALPVADIFYKEHAYDEAVKYYLKVISILEFRPEPDKDVWKKSQDGLLRCYVVIGRYREAINLTDALLLTTTKNSNKADLLSQKGLAYFRLGDYKNSENAHFEALELLGVHIPTEPKAFKLALLKEGFINVFIMLFRFVDFVKIKNKADISKEADKIYEIYQTLILNYILNDAIKYLYIVLRMVRLSIFKIGKSTRLAEALLFYAGIFITIQKKRIGFSILSTCLSIQRQFQNDMGQSDIFRYSGYGFSWTGELHRALECFTKSEHIYSRVGDVWELALIYNGKGHLYRYMADYEKSLRYYGQYHQLCKRNKDSGGIGSANSSLGSCFIEKGEFDRADGHLRTARSVCRKYDTKPYLCYSLFNSGYLEIERGDYDQAITFLNESKDLHESHRFLNEYKIHVYQYLAEAYLERYLERYDACDLDQAKKFVDIGLKKSRAWVNNYGSALRIKGRYCHVTEDYTKAEFYFLKSIKHTQKCHRRFEAAKGLYFYGLMLQDMDRHDLAKKKLRESYAIFKEIGAGHYIGKLRTLLGLDDNPTTSAQSKLYTKLELDSILTVTQHLSSILKLDELLDKIMDVSIEISGAERGYLFLKDSEDETRPLELKVASNVDENMLTEKEFEFSRFIIDKVEQTKEQVIVTDASNNDELTHHRSVVKYGLRSICCAPLMFRDKMVGIVYLDNHLIGGLFNEDKINVLKTLLVQAAISIENACLYKKSITDGLTHLYNRTFFHDYLLKCIHAVQRYHRRFCLMMIDIDSFKAVNDRYGHQIGDRVLERVSAVIIDRLRESDIAARYGGDEFIIILNETDKKTAHACAEHIRELIESDQYSYYDADEEVTLSVTVSIGITEFQEEMDHFTLIQNADRALYEAKSKGKNYISIL
ncbi:MAG: diguanylate cyclase [Candidatus Omnitrophica bacterium]|nr:diguanylate cyclase [Candidatus Omnitrophota bacterium]